jgi:hypothetical protein
MGRRNPPARGFLRAGSLAPVLCAALLSHLAWAQPPATERDTEHDAGKRALRALAMAEEAFDQAKKSYSANEIKQGDGHLDDMTKLLNSCLSALESSRKAHLYKQAEIRVETLLRRLQTLIEDIAADDRGWAEYTLRQVDGIHDKLLNGVMKK